jgi:hypothetical protein
VALYKESSNFALYGSAVTNPSASPSILAIFFASYKPNNKLKQDIEVCILSVNPLYLSANAHQVMWQPINLEAGKQNPKRAPRFKKTAYTKDSERYVVPI